MVQIIIADTDTPASVIRDLFYEYLTWGTSKVKQEFDVTFPVGEAIKQDMLSLDKFMPPRGRLLLAYVDDAPVGIACLKELTGLIGEVKRIYVHPRYRGLGIGKAL